MSVSEIFPFSLHFDTLAIAGVGLWALALYLGFYPFSQWIVTQLDRWLNFAERSLYLSNQEFERTRPAREAQNAFWASVLSIFPFLLLGSLCHFGLLLGLGQSWSISLGMISVIGGGVYELGRRDGLSGR